MTTIPYDCSVDQLQMLLTVSKEAHDVPGEIVEIGSWKCGTSAQLAAVNPKRTVYAFDLFGGMPYPDKHTFANFADTNFGEILASVASIKNLVLVRGRHEETVPEFARIGMPLALIFMDSDHYSSHKIALTCLDPLLSVGGYIVFHDWAFAEVQEATRETLEMAHYYQPREYAYKPGVQNMMVLKKVK
jgi:hypothetical protein